MASKVVFLRHGESVRASTDAFAGWADVDLSPAGVGEAVEAGRRLREGGFEFSAVYTSVLRRAVKTAWTALTESENFAMPIVNSWRLNGRHCGALQGLSAAEATAKHGEKHAQAWRRGCGAPPPPVDTSDPRHPANDPLYRHVPRPSLPCSESLELAAGRVLPFWHDHIAPRVMGGANVLVVAHGDSLRVFCKHLEGLSDEDAADLDIPAGVPLVYELDGAHRVLKKYYLADPGAVAEKTTAATAQGGPPAKYVLCTGGAGYIGSHTLVQLVESGYRVAVLDNFLNSSPKVLDRVRELCPGADVRLFDIDMLDMERMRALFRGQRFDAVIHFAGLKAVGESVAKPLWYYENNLRATLNLLKVMGESGCKALVFSSSATVYLPSEEPLDEGKPLGCSNPYGWTKFMIERFLIDAAHADGGLAVSILRYFNPVGAHPSGRIGEAPSSYPNNLMPFIQQVAVGRRECLSIFGTDYDTPDGTGVRDYLHVDDLAAGHICALRRVFETGGGCTIHNLGSGKGLSVRDVAQAFERVSGRPIPCKEVGRRPGDLATVVANPARAKAELGWEPTRGVEDMCRSTWNWVSQNPYGYDDGPPG